MPIFKLSTNLPKEKIPEDFIKTTADVVAKTLGKPLSYVAVQIKPDQIMGFGGKGDNCAICYLGSIGKLGREANKRHSQALFAHVEKQLGIPGDKMYINFQDIDKANCGYIGKTFDDLL